MAVFRRVAQRSNDPGSPATPRDRSADGEPREVPGLSNEPNRFESAESAVRRRLKGTLRAVSSGAAGG